MVLVATGGLVDLIFSYSQYQKLNQIFGRNRQKSCLKFYFFVKIKTIKSFATTI